MGPSGESYLRFPLPVMYWPQLSPNMLRGTAKQVWEMRSFIPSGNAHSLNWDSISKRKEGMDTGVSL